MSQYVLRVESLYIQPSAYTHSDDIATSKSFSLDMRHMRHSSFYYDPTVELLCGSVRHHARCTQQGRRGKAYITAKFKVNKKES